MEDLKIFEAAIETYIRPSTLPVAFKMLRSETEIPKGIERTIKTLGYRVALCQGWGKARHNGESVAMLKDDISCPIAILALGFAEPPELWWKADLYKGWYTPDTQAAERTAAEMDRLPVGEYVGAVTAPINACTFEPDLVLLYCTPVQALVLMSAALVQEGGKFPASFWPAGVCPYTIVPTLLTEKCQFGIPCFGDRKFAATSSDEVIFTIPSARFKEIANGLKYYYEHGHSFTVPRYIDGAPKFSQERYRELRNML